MKVKELVSLLSEYPQDMEVMFETDDGYVVEEMVVNAGQGQVVISEF